MRLRVSKQRTGNFAWGFAGAACLFCLDQAPLAASSNSEKKVKIPPAVERKVDYKKDVQPILEQSCYQCHGTNKLKGGLALNNRRDAFKGGDSGPAFVPGKS